jgi:hypothetical protein
MRRPGWTPVKLYHFGKDDGATLLLYTSPLQHHANRNQDQKENETGKEKAPS